MKLQICSLQLNSQETLTQMFSYNLSKIFKKRFLQNRLTTSVYSQLLFITKQMCLRIHNEELDFFANINLYQRQNRKFPFTLYLNVQKFLSLFLCPEQITVKQPLLRMTFDLYEKVHCNKVLSYFLCESCTACFKN